MPENHNSTDSQSTEERILVAAETEFLQKGFAGARTTLIAENAGVTHAMLHYYFRTKEKLFERIMHGKIGMLRNIMLGSLGDPDTPLFEKITAAIEEHLEFIAANPDLPRFVINEISGNPERAKTITGILAAHAPGIVAALQRQIDDCAACGECRRLDASMLMLDIVSLNIFSFLARPMVNPLLGGLMEDMPAFLAKRKKENVETIMRKLKP